MASNQPSDGVDPQVLIEEKSYVKIITMNRPRQLNALSANMVSQLLKSFIAYEEDANVKLVILKGKGRAFCAGGDVSAVANDVTNGHWKFGANFFRKEFTLNYILATYPKSQVSILNGIVMGGGAGVSIHGKFRVATENSVFAMPETALGLFPDIGASYFLSRLPGFFGEFVGLTGARLDGAEMLACGLATHFVSSSTLPLLEEALFKVDTSDPVVVNSIIEKFSQRVPLKQRSAFLRFNQKLFGGPTSKSKLKLAHFEWIVSTGASPKDQSKKFCMHLSEKAGCKVLISASSESSECAAMSCEEKSAKISLRVAGPYWWTRIKIQSGSRLN
ncbi:3-hydroxyisobutyryl-CoA hydrolase 1-like isoform X4 [Magnolia sinica]|uniref:3-hydroxyisobutyryl-CoA hydrolase 1-like isoform X4 n=1 Tax=Magnolia sinica TaxID=86752 RepID=UPI0026593F24|nr:3-hydroxyisobutyryl-CoA hydrolase 1-like isoform X4 [Magnolia sinica]